MYGCASILLIFIALILGGMWHLDGDPVFAIMAVVLGILASLIFAKRFPGQRRTSVTELETPSWPRQDGNA